MKKIDAEALDLKDKVVNIGRVTKVVKGGRTFRFTALVVVGDENGKNGEKMEDMGKMEKMEENGKKRKWKKMGKRIEGECRGEREL